MAQGRAAHAAARQHEEQALQLRAAGAAFTEIATALEMTREGARQAYLRALERRRMPDERLEEHFQLELARLDVLQRSLWQQAMNGDVAAHDRVLRIMAQRARLLGLDKQRVELTGLNGAAVQTNLEIDPNTIAEAIQALVDSSGGQAPRDPSEPLHPGGPQPADA